MYNRLTEIDDLTRLHHSFLEPEDQCYFMGEYTARAGYTVSATNDLISNLKKPMDRRGLPEWRYKGWAIRTVAEDLQRILGQRGIEAHTLVPVPPSKAKTDPMYDDRLVQVLGSMALGYDADVREMLLQRESMEPSHGGEVRTSISELVANYYIDPALDTPPKDNGFVVFDDMLTTGRHFKAAQDVLLTRYPDSKIYGIFVARRVPNTGNLEDLF